VREIKTLRKRIDTLKALRGVLSVWSTLAVNRYRRYSLIASGYRPYLERIREVIGLVVAMRPGLRSKLLEEREERRVDLVLITSDRGYVGDFVSGVLEEAESFLKGALGKYVKVFVIGRKGSERVPGRPEVFEGVITKDVNWSEVGRIGEVLISRFRGGESDACYVVFQRPEVGTVGGGAFGKKGGTGGPQRHPPTFFYGLFEGSGATGTVPEIRGGNYGPVLLRFLPPEVRPRPDTVSVVNIEGDEEAFLNFIVYMYLKFFLRCVFLDHFVALNLARYRTVRRIMKNAEERIRLYRGYINRLRQERINREIQDMVLALLSSEEKLWKTPQDAETVLEVDREMSGDLRRLLIARLTSMGFRIGEVREGDLLGGFRILGPGYERDLSVAGFLKALKEKIKRIYYQ
jgi:F-type H+-transporting ATPase subunit gamma